MHASRELAEAAVSTPFGQLPDEVVGTAKACLLDTLGVALAGCRHPLVSILRQVLGEFGGSPQASLIGLGARASLPDAALVNGAAAHALDFDDMHLAASMHPSAPVVPAAMGVAELHRLAGRELLRAIALGIEAELRIGSCVNPAHYERGWHATATLGRFGATIAVACLLGLDARQTQMAIGIAGTQAAGLKEVFGTMSKPLHAGVAARDGVLAAMLAGRGFTGAETILEGGRGFGNVAAAGADWSVLTRDWGRRWQLQEILYKPHAAAFCCQALIEAVICLRRNHGLRASDVRAVRGAVSRQSVENARVGEPGSGLEGKFSLTHAAAQALAFGHATEADFTDQRVLTEDLRRLRQRVSVTVGEGLAWPEAAVEIDLVDGRTLREAIDLRRKSASATDKWSIVEPKFRQIAEGLGFPAGRVDALVDAVRGVDAAPDIGQVLVQAGSPV